MLRAKHDFKLQIKPNEFVHFKSGQTVPKQYYEGNSPYAVFIQDHCETGVLKSQVVIPDMVRIRELPEHVKEQETARAKIGAVHPIDLPTTVNAGATAFKSDIPQKQTGAPQPVPKMEPLQEGHVRKGGQNPDSSQVKTRPSPPSSMKPAHKR